MSAPTDTATAPPPPALRTRKPTGKPGWPRILLSGAEGSWKSGTAAMLSADERLGEMFWLEVGDGETTADEYGALPGVRYTIVDHDGTWIDIYNQLCAAWDVAKAAEDAGAPPRPLAIDAMSGIHGMLMELGDTRARKKAAKQLADRDRSEAVAWSADYDPTMTPDLWALIRKRHRQVMTKILTWPAPVVLTSRERIATVFENGNPTTKKDWTLECRKDLPSDVTAWVRTEGGGVARILKLRSARAAVSVELGERGRKVSDFNLSTLVFDWVGCEVGVSRAARSVRLDADQDMPDEVDDVTPSQEQPRNGYRNGNGYRDAPRNGNRGAQGGHTAAAGQAPPTKAERVRNAVDALLNAADVDAAGTAEARVLKAKDLAQLNISGLLTEKDCDELSLNRREPIHLPELAAAVCTYVGSNKRAVRKPAPEQPADEGQDPDGAAHAGAVEKAFDEVVGREVRKMERELGLDPMRQDV